MTKLTKAIIAGACALFAPFVSAQAADAPIYEVYEKPEYQGSWYLRGDIGYVVQRDPVVTYGGVVTFLNEDLSNTWMIGGGFGYRHNSWFRSDITFDWRRSNFYGETPCGCGPNSNEYAKIDSWTILLNVYADLGTWYLITPYVGAGIGAAYNKVHGIVSYDAVPSVTYFPNGGKWNLSAAVMAGFAINIASGWVVDTGYRYIWLGDAESGVDGIGNTIYYDNLASHEIRMGVRYEY